MPEVFQHAPHLPFRVCQAKQALAKPERTSGPMPKLARSIGELAAAEVHLPGYRRKTARLHADVLCPTSCDAMLGGMVPSDPSQAMTQSSGLCIQSSLALRYAYRC